MPQHRSQAKVQGVSRVSEEVRGRRGPWVPHEGGVDQVFQQQCNEADGDRRKRIFNRKRSGVKTVMSKNIYGDVIGNTDFPLTRPSGLILSSLERCLL